MILSLVRFAYLPDATLGWLYVAGLRFATIEDAWRPDPDGPGGQRRDGALKESCIPDGHYRLVPHSGEKFQNVWCMINPQLGVYRQPGDIPAGLNYGRSACLIHAGNSAENVLGCIAVGMEHDPVKQWIFRSQDALTQLRSILGTDKEHELQIRPIAGTAEKL